jgi:hypothetical protein
MSGGYINRAKIRPVFLAILQKKPSPVHKSIAFKSPLKQRDRICVLKAFLSAIKQQIPFRCVGFTIDFFYVFSFG